MAKLYFRYGAMGSAKTLNLLAVRHNYEVQGKRVMLLKPCVDVRFGAETVRSRAGLEYPADLLVEPEDRLQNRDLEGLHCILVDECQFLTRCWVDHLREVTRTHGIPVIAYGLRTNFRAELFEGSKRLMEVADSIEEIKTTCKFCNRKAVFNLRHDAQGRALIDGPDVLLGAEATYSPTCYPCYHDRVAERWRELESGRETSPTS